MIVYVLIREPSNIFLTVARTVEELLPTIKAFLHHDDHWTCKDGPLNVTVHVGEMTEEDFEKAANRVGCASGNGTVPHD